MIERLLYTPAWLWGHTVLWRTRWSERFRSAWDHGYADGAEAALRKALGPPIETEEVVIHLGQEK